MAFVCRNKTMSGAPHLLAAKPQKALETRSQPKPKKLAKRQLLPFPVKDDAVVVCKDNLLFMRSLPDQSMKLIVTSPPYNLGKEYETKSSLNANLDAQGETIKEAVRLLHPSGSICWQIGNYVEDGEVYPL